MEKYWNLLCANNYSILNSNNIFASKRWESALEKHYANTVEILNTLENEDINILQLD